MVPPKYHSTNKWYPKIDKPLGGTPKLSPNRLCERPKLAHGADGRHRPREKLWNRNMGTDWKNIGKYWKLSVSSMFPVFSYIFPICSYAFLSVSSLFPVFSYIFPICSYAFLSVSSMFPVCSCIFPICSYAFHTGNR